MKNLLAEIIALIIIAPFLIFDAPIGVLLLLGLGAYAIYAYTSAHPKIPKTSKKKRILTKEEESMKKINDKIDAMIPLTDDEHKKISDEYDRTLWSD